MSAPNNPAGRLQVILTKLKQANGGNSIAHAWAHALSLDVGDYVSVTTGIGKTMALTGQVQDEMARLDHYHPYLVGWRTQLAQLFANSTLSVEWSQVNQYLTDDVIAGVEACSMQLSRERGEPVLKDEDREVLDKELRDLYRDIHGSDMEAVLKSYLLDRVRTIIQLFRHADMDGAKEVFEQVQIIVAEVGLNEKLRDRVEKREEGRRFWQILERLYLAFQLGTAPFQIAEFVRPDLPQIQPPSITVNVEGDAHSTQSDETSNGKNQDSDSGELKPPRA